ncbi:UNKNOWN [Stylonychia lemnae]|uniref:Uncharacterized protein n=1 Tax=Stylonychia lemnae TaxID=5949 RepID=A0A078ASM8_STYLE|nr:UNKNOWN [Stylonychia lemnae]|eukprot:CDW85179.1 UNKNOWN [Stylonychia lemnae]
MAVTVSSGKHIAVNEVTQFGEDNIWIKILKGNMAVALTTYQSLLGRQVHQYRADQCYQDLWDLADNIITSFGTMGASTIPEFIGLGLKVLTMAIFIFHVGSHCTPLLMTNPPTYVPKAESAFGFFIGKALTIISDIIGILKYDEMFSYARDMSELLLSVEEVVEYLI